MLRILLTVSVIAKTLCVTLCPDSYQGLCNFVIQHSKTFKAYYAALIEVIAPQQKN